jgi:hypothetical protein
VKDIRQKANRHPLTVAHPDIGFPRGIRVSSVVNYACPSRLERVLWTDAGFLVGYVFPLSSITHFRAHWNILVSSVSVPFPDSLCTNVFFISISLRILYSADRPRAERSAVRHSSWEVVFEKEEFYTIEKRSGLPCTWCYYVTMGN